MKEVKTFKLHCTIHLLWQTLFIDAPSMTKNKEESGALSHLNGRVGFGPTWQKVVVVCGLVGFLALYVKDSTTCVTHTWAESSSRPDEQEASSTLRIQIKNADGAAGGDDSSSLAAAPSPLKELRTRAPFDFDEIVETQQLARAFLATPDHDEPVLTTLTGTTTRTSNSTTLPSWCTRAYHPSAPTGLIYVKVHKTASSTTAGVAQRIADRVGYAASASIGQGPCDVKYSHTHVRNKENKKYWKEAGAKNHHLNQAGNFYRHRNKDRSFLFATIRDPTAHAMSEVFFKEVTQDGMDPTDENMIGALQISVNTASQDGYGGFQLAYASMDTLEKGEAWRQDSPETVHDPELTIRRVKRIVEDYDFLMDVDRYDESLVALQMLLHLSPADILYLPSKGPNAAYTRGGGPNDTCIPKIHSFVSDKVQEYLESDQWYAQGYGDFLLKAAVSKSSDMTIEQLGKDRFRRALSEFLTLKEDAATACLSEAVFPCGPNGEDQMSASRSNCYKLDEGCGYPCLDKFVAL
jgi:hypothetical protein